MTSNTTEDQPEAVNVIDGFIPNEFLVEATANAFKFSVIVKQFFILQAGICVKMRRTMEKHLRNLQIRDEYLAWVNNLKLYYPRAAINQYMLYTTKTGSREYTARDIWRRFGKGLEKFHNTLCSNWTIVLNGPISGKSWKEL